MELSTPLFFVFMSLYLVQQSTVCDANWFTDLMARFGNSGQRNKDAHAAVYGETDNQQGSFSPSQPARTSGKNTGSLTHELIAAAAGWEAMRVYERQQAKKTGQPPNHSMVKGIVAGLAAAAVDRLIETRGMDWLDAQRAKQGAARAAENMVDEYERSQGRGNNNGRGNDQGRRGGQGNRNTDGQDDRALTYAGPPSGNGNNDEY